MCGICGVHGPHPDPERVTRTMMAALRHRGPDDERLIRVGPTTLGHVRLSIVDPEGGHQPHRNEDGTIALAGNGEIYNHRGLRARLAGHAFASEADTEAALHLFEQDGPAFARALDGMYALAVADGRDLLLARDPLGIKPLYLARDGATTYFASELKALAPLGLAIEAVPPGSVWHSRLGRRGAWSLPDAADELRDPDEAASVVRATLERAVEKRLMADVPLGSFLSGGLDSSAIAALAIRRTRRLRTFAVGTDGSPDLVAARQVAEHIGSDHHEHLIDPDEVRRRLPEIVAALESFDADLVRSVVPTWFTARLAARHVKVVLTGEGADELFAGYAYHADYDGAWDALAHELGRSLTTMHDLNLQRVDRMTMAHGLEARVPFLDTELIDVAQRIDPRLKRHGGVEKWILRRAVEDVLPDAIVWRDKAQFDEGSGATDLLTELTREAAAAATAEGVGADLPLPPRTPEEALYYRWFAQAFPDPDAAAAVVGRWRHGRTDVAGASTGTG
jgi:asparagine synthase (glutamine-hydrolysing)